MIVNRAGEWPPLSTVEVAPAVPASDPVDRGVAFEPVRRERRWLVWVLPVFFWSLPALLATHVVMRQSGLGFWRSFLMEGAAWFLWAFATPGMIALARRFPLDRPHLGRTLAMHVGVGLTMGALMGLASAALTGIATRGTTVAPRPPIHSAMAFWCAIGVLFYGATASVGFAIEYYRKLREREVAASRLEAQLVEAKLSALRMQLQPHFLFNALNAVSMLVRQGEDATAVRVVARLSDLLRYILDGGGEPLVPLREEVDFIARYLEIEQLRFRDRLDVRITVSDDVADLPVPGLLLQPLVENAVRHGVAARASAALIALDAHAHEGRLLIRLRDDGPGFAAGKPDDSCGIGLRNTRARLRYLYGDDASLRIADAPGGGAEVTLTLPIGRYGDG